MHNIRVIVKSRLFPNGIRWKFIPKKPVTNPRGRKIVAIIVSRFITSFRRLDTVER